MYGEMKLINTDMKTKGHTYLTQEERNTILFLRERMGWNIRSIAMETGRSESTVKRIVYDWPSQAK